MLSATRRVDAACSLYPSPCSSTDTSAADLRILTPSISMSAYLRIASAISSLSVATAVWRDGVTEMAVLNVGFTSRDFVLAGAA